jgi:hypothetical protein
MNERNGRTSGGGGAGGLEIETHSSSISGPMRVTISTWGISGAKAGSPMPQRQQTQRWQSTGAAFEVSCEGSFKQQGEQVSLRGHPA